MLKPAAPVSTGNFLQMQTIGSTPDLKNKWGEAICILASLQVILMHAEVEKHCLSRIQFIEHLLSCIVAYHYNIFHAYYMAHRNVYFI